MALKNLFAILTKKRKEKEDERNNEEIKRVAEELRKVMALPAVKDLVGKVNIADYHTEGTSYSWGSLSLTNEGLQTVTGFHDSCGGEFSNSHRSEPVKVSSDEYEKVVAIYSLTMEDVRALMQKLEE